jgi:hypothetical protein
VDLSLTQFQLTVRCASGQREQWRDRELVGGVVEDQFKTADVTARHALRFGCAAVVGDLSLTGRTLPRH